MTLPKSLIFSATTQTEDVLLLEDELTGEVLDFVTLGQFDFNNCHYIYGMDGSDYDKCFGKQNQKEMEIQFFEVIEENDGTITYSNAISFTEEEEITIYNMIKGSLESHVVAAKYGLN